jgi:hypothetical protein
MDEPFQRIALDFVGPLPMTDSKNRFIFWFVSIMLLNIQKQLH